MLNKNEIVALRSGEKVEVVLRGRPSGELTPVLALALSCGAKVTKRSIGWGYSHAATGMCPPRGHVGYESAELAADAFLQQIGYLYEKTKPS